MRERFKRFFRDRILTSLFIGAALLNAASVLLLMMSVTPGEQPIPLHYNIYFGIDAIGPWYAWYYLPLGSVFFLLLNTGIALWLVLRERILARVNLIIATFVSLLILLSVFSSVRALL